MEKNMIVKRINDNNGGEYIVIISDGKVFLGHEKKSGEKKT